MVKTRTLTYDLDCDPFTSTRNSAKQLLLHPIDFPQKTTSQLKVKQNATKNVYWNPGIKLMPLDTAKKETECKAAQLKEKELLLRSSSSVVKKKIISKIPVLQKSSISKYKNKSGDPSLSAADRRQKFCESRQHLTDAVKSNNYVQEPVNSGIALKDDGLQINVNSVKKVNLALQPVTSKAVLPLIKNPYLAVGTQVPPRKKCLMGEITHFPALFIHSKPRKIPTICLVPHLPPIFRPQTNIL